MPLGATDCFRIEHPQTTINRAQYGPMADYCEDGGKGALPPASYRLTTTVAETAEGGDEGGIQREGEAKVNPINKLRGDKPRGGKRSGGRANPPPLGALAISGNQVKRSGDRAKTPRGGGGGEGEGGSGSDQG